MNLNDTQCTKWTLIRYIKATVSMIAFPFARFEFYVLCLKLKKQRLLLNKHKETWAILWTGWARSLRALARSLRKNGANTIDSEMKKGRRSDRKVASRMGRDVAPFTERKRTKGLNAATGDRGYRRGSIFDISYCIPSTTTGARSITTIIKDTNPKKTLGAYGLSIPTDFSATIEYSYRCLRWDRYVRYSYGNVFSTVMINFMLDSNCVTKLLLGLLIVNLDNYN